ncbi:class I SAM-dependent methyltransferase [Clostridiales bacterium COT073_COT-073]|nr:class I SAM-dependent methyltransferase [Clostridiales bacterium COT073_COT-073]
MDKLWSEKVQGIMTLYLSRKLRFNQDTADSYKQLFQLDEHKNLRILEIGCGPGALAEAMRAWYPQAEIVAIDRDVNFIKFASENIKGVEFMEADIEKMPFAKESFDVILSNTVSEHIETSLFFSKQYELLKKGGICLCLSTVKGIEHRADCFQESQFEEMFWEKVNGMDDTLKKYNIGKYRLNEQELPLTMEKYGFTKILTGYVLANLTPDNPYQPKQRGIDIIEANRRADLEILDKLWSEKSPLIKENEIRQMIDLTEQKYEQRLQLYHQNKKQWDCQVTISLVVRGEK